MQGVRDDVAAKAVEREIAKLVVFETGGVALASNAARNDRTLRSRGHTVRKTIDCLIATFLSTRTSLVALPRDSLH